MLQLHLGALNRSNTKAAHLRWRASSVHSSAEDKSLVRLECDALLKEVRNQQRDFLAAIKGEPPHGRLDDVAAGYRRLVDLLQVISRGQRERSVADQ